MGALAPARSTAPLRWFLFRALVLAFAYTLPLTLLCLRLWQEMQDGTLPLDGSAVLVRFIVVGLFALIFSRWCLHWMRRRPR